MLEIPPEKGLGFEVISTQGVQLKVSGLTALLKGERHDIVAWIHKFTNLRFRVIGSESKEARIELQSHGIT